MFNLESLNHWLTANPDWGIAFSFIMAFAESMIFIGGIIPGSLAITAIGTLAGADIIPIYPTLFAAILGAIGGDFASFFVGRYFKEQLKEFTIFKKYPKTIAYGEHFFKKHGAKSVFFARFIGPIRAIVPAIAGMMNMRIHHFIFANSLSAVGWSILFFYPGVLIGRGHENIQKYLVQILLGIFIFVVMPILLVKLAYHLRRYVVSRYAPKINQFWQISMKKWPVLHALTPKTTIQEYHLTISEVIVLFFAIFFIFLNLVFPIYYQSVEWLKIPMITPFTQHHLFYAFDDSQWLTLLTLGFIYSIFQKQKSFFYALVFISIGLSPWLLSSYTIFIFSNTFAIQYLILRAISRHKMHLYQFFYIFFTIFWSLATYLVSVHLQQSMNIPLLTGLVIAQIAWLFMRKKQIHFQYPQYWLLAFLLEPLLQIFRFLRPSHFNFFLI